MARIRSVKPAFWADEDMATELRRDLRLLYIGLWNLCYDNWTMEYKPRSIKRELFGFDDDVTPDVLDAWVHEIAATGRIVFFEFEGRACIWLPKCHEHQQVNRPQPSPLPLPEGTIEVAKESAHGAFTEHSVNNPPRAQARVPIPSSPIHSSKTLPDANESDDREPPAYSLLPECFAKYPTTKYDGIPFPDYIPQIVEKRFGMLAPTKYGQFCAALAEGCLPGCDGNKKQCAWCIEHVTYKVANKPWAHLLMSMRNDREVVPPDVRRR
jgi:hypothetical protein